MEGCIKDGTVLRELEKKLSGKDETFWENNRIIVRLPIKFSLNGACVVDVETSGLYPGRGGLITTGVVHDGYITMIQRLKSGGGYHEEFRDYCFVYLDKNFGHKDLYAYNYMFEERWLGLKFNEVDPMCNGGRGKDACIDFRDLHFGKGSEVIDEWRKWKRSSDPVHVMNIMLHNAQCLLKETSLFLISDEVVDDG